jgi:hypothetical protein
MTKNLEFDLSKSKSATLTEKLTIPAGTPDGQYVFQVEAYATSRATTISDDSFILQPPTVGFRRLVPPTRSLYHINMGVVYNQ